MEEVQAYETLCVGDHQVNARLQTLENENRANETLKASVKALTEKVDTLTERVDTLTAIVEHAVTGFWGLLSERLKVTGVLCEETKAAMRHLLKSEMASISTRLRSSNNSFQSDVGFEHQILTQNQQLLSNEYRAYDAMHRMLGGAASKKFTSNVSHPDDSVPNSMRTDAYEIEEGEELSLGEFPREEAVEEEVKRSNFDHASLKDVPAVKGQQPQQN